MIIAVDLGRKATKTNKQTIYKKKLQSFDILNCICLFQLVLALYPQTTCFYRALIHMPPKKVGTGLTHHYVTHESAVAQW